MCYANFSPSIVLILKTQQHKTLGDGELVSSENAKCTVLKATNVTINFYPTTRTLQIQGKRGNDLKSSLINLLERNNEYSFDEFESHQSLQVEQDSCTRNDDSIEELRHLESFIDIAAETIVSSQQTSLQSEDGCTCQINKIWEAIDEINSKIEAFDLITSKDTVSTATGPSKSPKDFQIPDDLLRENALLKSKLNDAETEIKRIKEENFSLVTALRLLNANYSEMISKCAENGKSSITTATDEVPVISLSQDYDQFSRSGNAVANPDPTKKSISSQIDDYRTRQREKYGKTYAKVEEQQSTHPKNIVRDGKVEDQMKEYKSKQSNKFNQKQTNGNVDNRSSDDPQLKKKEKKPKKKNKKPSVSTAKPQTSNTVPEQPINGNVDKGNQNRPTVVIIGDSMLKNVHGWRLSKNVRAEVKSFSGATVEDMFDYIKPTLKNQPDEIIIHIGTNNLKRSNPREVAEKIVDLGHMVCNQSPAIKVTISFLITRNDKENLAAKVKEVNSILRKFAMQNEWNIITNSNITEEHLNRSGLHLNQTGTKILALNFSSHINKSIVASK